MLCRNTVVPFLVEDFILETRSSESHRPRLLTSGFLPGGGSDRGFWKEGGVPSRPSKFTTNLSQNLAGLVVVMNNFITYFTLTHFKLFE